MKLNSSENELRKFTQSQFLPSVWRQREAEERHRGDQHARDDQVEEVVKRPPPHVDGEGDVHIRLGAALVDNAVPLSRHV